MGLNLPHIFLFGSGVGAHRFFFKRGEHHRFALHYLKASLLAFFGLAFFQLRYYSLSILDAVALSFSWSSLFLLGALSSLLTYRICFNPLNSIPGPYFTRITRLYASALVLTRHDSHLMLNRLHQRYGHFVRVGPNDISVTHPAAMHTLHGTESKFTKAPFYDADYPQSSIQTTRSREVHDLRKKHWAGAFSDKALRGYEQRVVGYIDSLVRNINRFEDKPINCVQWFTYFTFDVMGDLAFGRSFEMLQSGDAHWIIQTIADGLEIFGTLFPTWLFLLLASIPLLTRDYMKMKAYCSAQIQARIQRHSLQDVPDIAHYLIEAMQKVEDLEESRKELDYDTKLIIVAGSDTTAATLSYLFFWLAKYPAFQAKLRQELDVALADGDITHSKLQEIVYLTGCIYETLRLNPPTPSGLFRKAPREGAMIGDIFIPGDTVVQIPIYALGHDQTNYEQPETFLPERWSTSPELIKNREAFQPFGMGPYGCIGKQLALMNIRLVTARIIRDFDVKLADGETGQRLFEESRDHFTIALKPLNLIFNSRK